MADMWGPGGRPAPVPIPLRPKLGRDGSYRLVPVQPGPPSAPEPEDAEAWHEAERETVELDLPLLEPFSALLPVHRLGTASSA